jgi:predicted DNA-binding transcriptional regulator YafY
MNRSATSTIAQAPSSSERLEIMLEFLRGAVLPTAILDQWTNQRLVELGFQSVSQRTLQQDRTRSAAKHGLTCLTDTQFRSTYGEAEFSSWESVVADEIPARKTHGIRSFWRRDHNDEMVKVDRHIDLISTTEIIALSLARQLVSVPAAPGLAASGDGPVSDALATLGSRLGIHDEPGLFLSIAPSREHWSPVVLQTLLAALRAQHAVTFFYRTLAGKAGHRTVQPVRLIWIQLEPYLVAWEPGKGYRQFKVSRLVAPQQGTTRLAHAPVAEFDQAIRALTESAFGTSLGSEDPADMRSYSVLIEQHALPHIQGRLWGQVPVGRSDAQGDAATHGIPRQVDVDMPGTWYRLTFNSSADPAAIIHWVLGMGCHAKIESPTEILVQLQENLKAMRAHYE